MASSIGPLLQNRRKYHSSEHTNVPKDIPNPLGFLKGPKHSDVHGIVAPSVTSAPTMTTHMSVLPLKQKSSANNINTTPQYPLMHSPSNCSTDIKGGH